MTLELGATGKPESQVLSVLSDDLAAHNNFILGSVGGSATYPSASLALFYPFYLTAPRTYTKAWWVNGAAVAGNVDVGIYTISGTTATRVVASTAEAQATVSVMQVAATFTTTTVGPGLYYLAISCTSATAAFWRTGMNALSSRFLGCFQAAGQSPLPSSCTVVAYATGAIIPFFGVSELSTI